MRPTSTGSPLTDPDPWAECLREIDHRIEVAEQELTTARSERAQLASQMRTAGMTWPAIATAFGLTPERARQIAAKQPTPPVDS